MANQNGKNEAQNPEKQKRKVSPALTVVLIFLFGLLIFISWLYIDQKKTTTQITDALSREKDSLENEFVDLRNEYDSLKTTNDSMNLELEQEQSRIDNLISELKTVKATNYTKIKKLQDELKTVRSVAKSYVRQIDSLNQLNQELLAENKIVRENLEETEKSKKQLEEDKETLTEQVTRAKVLRTEDLNAIPINKKGKEKNRVDKIEKIKVCFKVEENDLVEPGERYFYIRIASPEDDAILTNSEDNLFEYEDEKIVYSARRQIEYTGEEQDVCIYFDTEGELDPGEYTVFVFADGNQIGDTTFQLEESGWLFF
ncbi:MAG: coiled-coil domain-containing protein [Bacteroidales bacterium]